MSSPSINEKINYYSSQVDQWKRQINPHNYPTLFRIIDVLKQEEIVFSFAIIAIFLMLVTIFNRLDCLNPNFISFEEIQKIQTTLLSASAIIVSLLIAFVVSKYFEIQRFRTAELNKFIVLQNKLVKYQTAFYTLGDQLERKYRLHPKYPLNHKQALADCEYFCSPDTVIRATKPDACIFTSVLQEFGRESTYFDDFDLNRRIMSKEKLKELEDCLRYLFGALDRQKQYKYLLEDLGVPEEIRHSSHFSTIKIAQNTAFVKESSIRISPKKEQENWESLEFWRDRINEAQLILEKMLRFVDYLHDYNANLIRKFLLPLIVISAFGIVIPLVLLSIRFSENFEYYLTYAAITVFLVFFILIISIVYSELTSRDIQRL